jgi:hypothetical protein
MSPKRLLGLDAFGHYYPDDLKKKGSGMRKGGFKNYGGGGYTSQNLSVIDRPIFGRSGGGRYHRYGRGRKCVGRHCKRSGYGRRGIRGRGIKDLLKKGWEKIKSIGRWAAPHVKSVAKDVGKELLISKLKGKKTDWKGTIKQKSTDYLRKQLGAEDIPKTEVKTPTKAAEAEDVPKARSSWYWRMIGQGRKRKSKHHRQGRGKSLLTVNRRKRILIAPYTRRGHVSAHKRRVRVPVRHHRRR